ncbi:dephospho-CoA kinase [Fodinibius sp. SL11]|uniref:dephospho-CoA kinase n=1 Tax=Fodinibius sp. SL11 TaxID=3425690 RepID=UPI003F88177B
MVTVGVTGGIGSGKSTVCDIWAQLGAYVLNADDLAKKVMVTNAEVKQQLIDVFGVESFSDDGKLNTNHLASEAFEKGRVKELNAIVHPKMPEAASQIIKEAEAQGYEVFVYEAALLLENLEPGFLDYIVLVLADEKHRIKRVKERDRSSEAHIQQRIDKQRDLKKATDQVDYVIRNNGSLEELEKKAEIIYQNFI